jgi:hypothetical protein
VVENQRIEVVDLDRDRRRAAAELPIVGNPMHRHLRRDRPDLTYRETEAGDYLKKTLGDAVGVG